MGPINCAPNPDIKRLKHKGYPTADETTRDTINVRHFLRGLNDQTLAVAVGMKDPKTIDDAHEMVETYNSLRDDVGRNQKVQDRINTQVIYRFPLAQLE